MSNKAIASFLDRIGYQGSTDVTLATLTGLQRAFLLSVPFENLDLHFDDKTKLSFTAFYEKIVDHHRGELSYECNGLLYDMLRSMEFNVQLLSARIVFADQLTPEFDHLVLLVTFDQDIEQQAYLVDVGIGQSCVEPIALGRTDEYVSEKCSYRLGTFQGQDALFYKSTKTDWQPRFIFSTEPRALVDFAAMYRFHQSSKESVFTQGQLVTMMTPTGRVTLNGMSLTVVDGDQRDVRELVSQADYFECLKTYFGIEFES